jgi:hypothetical protein
MQFPEGRRFAFTILDDTDDSTLENVRPVYDRLRHHGLRTTKTVWPLDCPEGSRRYFAADTLQRREYLAFVKELVAGGFELALHGATMESSDRERTIRGLEFIQQEFGFLPRLYANHGENQENLYWGASRLRSAALRGPLWPLRRGRRQGSSGEIPDSPYFWGDLCAQHIEYVRNLTFRSLNLLAANPQMPYRLTSTPYVAYWFSTADAADAVLFKYTVTRERLDRLEEEGGACIISTHLGKKFARDGRLDPEIDELFGHVASKPGWFVPVSTLLDYLREHCPGAGRSLGHLELFRLECRYLVDQAVSWLTDPSGTYP